MSTIKIYLPSGVVTVLLTTIIEVFFTGFILFGSIGILSDIYESWKLQRGSTLRLYPSTTILRKFSLIFSILSTIIFALIELGVNGIKSNLTEQGTVFEVKNATVISLNSELLGEYRAFGNRRLHDSFLYKGVECFESNLTEVSGNVSVTRLKVEVLGSNISEYSWVPMHDAKCGGTKFLFRSQVEYVTHNCGNIVDLVLNKTIEIEAEHIFIDSNTVNYHVAYLPECLNLGRHVVYYDQTFKAAAYTTSNYDSAVLMSFNETHGFKSTIEVLEHDGVLDYGAELVLNWIHRHGQSWELIFSSIINSVYELYYYTDSNNSSYFRDTYVWVGSHGSQYTSEKGELVIGHRNVTEINKLSIVIIVVLVTFTLFTLIIAIFAKSRLENYNLTDPHNIATAIMSSFDETKEDSEHEVILAISHNDNTDSLRLYRGGRTGRRQGFPLIGHPKNQ